ncbi:MAG: galactokinase [Prevotellaceae bacterium]|jgi:galactokinase|nr:galactokinase [Prevotellaceae bacterium]
MITEKLHAAFVQQFGASGAQYTSPGRINLIGEHVDYNGGYVLPGAIDKAIFLEIRPNGTNKSRVFSQDYNERAEFGLNETDKPQQPWAHYVFGVARELIKRGGKIEGFDAVFTGNVPLGAGLSSSAALESVFAFALNELFACGVEKKQLAVVGQMTEHHYAGVKCGIMDQFASVFGKKNHLIRLNCDTLEYEYVPCELGNYRLVLVDSCVKHTLVDSPYDRRRESCERVVKAIAQRHPQVKVLAHATWDMLKEVQSTVSEVDYRRATFVVGEIKRVEKVCAALKNGDLEEVGKNMYATHQGLSKDYEVSCEEVDFLSECAQKYGAAGARIMGGGFGGCTINLVKSESYDNFVEKIAKDYTAKFGLAPKVYDVKIEDGARVIADK